MKKFLLFFCLALLAFPATAESLKVGDTPPDSLGRGVDGKPIHISELKGKVVVVTFWATWCPPCMKELPILDNIQRQVSTDRLQVIAVNFGQDRKTFWKIKRRLKDAALMLTRDSRKSVANRYRVEGIPNMFIINKQGKISAIHVGYSEGEIQHVVDELNVLLKS